MGFVLEDEERWGTESTAAARGGPPPAASAKEGEGNWYPHHTLRYETILLPSASNTLRSVEANVRRAETKLKKRYAMRYDPQVGPQVHWVDMSVLVPRVAQLKCFHRLNRFPNMQVICRKMIFFSSA